MSPAFILAIVVELTDVWEPREVTLEGKSVPVCCPNSTAERGSYSANSCWAPERENGKIESCATETAEDRQIHNADRNFPQKR